MLFNFIFFSFLLFPAVTTLFHDGTLIQFSWGSPCCSQPPNCPPKSPTSCYSCPSVFPSLSEPGLTCETNGVMPLQRHNGVCV